MENFIFCAVSLPSLIDYYRSGSLPCLQVDILGITATEKCYKNIPALQMFFNLYCFISEIKLQNDINNLLRLILGCHNPKMS